MRENQTFYRKTVSDAFCYVHFDPITWVSLGYLTVEDYFDSRSELVMEIASSRSKW